MSDAAGDQPIWGGGTYRLHVVALSFRDAAHALPHGWAARTVREMDAYFRDVSRGPVRWTMAGLSRLALSERSRSFQLQRRHVDDRIRFWRHLLAELGPLEADAVLAVVSPEAAVRGCFAIGSRWNSRLTAFLRAAGGITTRGALVRSTTGWGTIAHELGHVLGLPDLYDYALARVTSEARASAFVGAWDLMGRTPREIGGRLSPMAWTQALAGWIQPAVVDESGGRFRIGLSGQASALACPLDGSRTLFVEPRFRRGYDAPAPSEGVLVSVADPNRLEGRGPLTIIAPPRPGDSEREASLGPYWNAPLQSGESLVVPPYRLQVLDREDEAFAIQISRGP